MRAAHDLFVEKGYEAATLNDIVRRSGGSLATLYALFENKPGLLKALVSERCKRIGGALDGAVAADRPPTEVLSAIAEEMLDMLFDGEFVGLFRIVLSQSARHPELGQQFYLSGPAQAQAKMAAYLTKLGATGQIAIDDPLSASRLFYQIVAGELKTRLMFGMPLNLKPSDRARHVEFSVKAFLKIHDGTLGCAPVV